MEGIIRSHPGVAEVVVFGIPDPEAMVRHFYNGLEAVKQGCQMAYFQTKKSHFG
jgi:acyl-CoA synthetase (AMP-forming)/AMP-acid ligase II